MRGRFLAGATLALMSTAALGQTISGPPAGVSINQTTGMLRLVASGVSDNATDTLNTTVKWTSPAAAAKAETLPACNPAAKALTILVKDGAGTASTYPITVTASSGTIDGGASYALNVSRMAVPFQCDGVNDWTIE